jgi:hypothetical protein
VETVISAQVTSTRGQAVPPNPLASLLPLHLRTPEQLRKGLVVNVSGASAGADDLAVARLIQDGAQYIAGNAGTTMGLVDVDVNFQHADDSGALGLANFRGAKGWFGLSKRSTVGMVEGIRRLRETPFDKWTEAQRQDFIQANETILHEAGHVTLNGYSENDVNEWRRAARNFEEGLTEIVTMSRIGDFMKSEFGVTVPDQTNRVSQSTSAYTRYTERISRMLSMGTDGSDAAVAGAAALVADKVPASKRLSTIAQNISTTLGGPKAPPEITKEIENTLEGFVDEKNGTRTRLMQLQAALIDFRSGKPFDLDAFKKSIAETDRKFVGPLDPSPRIGFSPLD